jgi:uncharacterized membrane protein
MTKGRLEAFSDGVIAILITIMVLELKVPHGADLAALRGLTPVFLTYVMSFIYLGIYWNNHHHLLHAVERISGRVLWPNLHLLFWLSLVPAATGWMGENHFAPLPVAVYGCVLLCAALAFRILLSAILSVRGANAKLAEAVGTDVKGWVSVAIYVASIPLAFVSPWISIALFATVAIIWLVPDQRIEQKLHHG